VSPERRDEDGIPRVRRAVSAPRGGAAKEELWPGANEEKAEKLRVRSLKRRAGAQGLELRHSAYGYALIDSTRKPVNDRSDMSLREIESVLHKARSE
jgi:hypothetical protein